MVREFHVALDHPVSDVPMEIPQDRLRLRLSLIAEETIELLCAITGQTEDAEREYKAWMNRMVMSMLSDFITGNLRPNLVKIADNCCDAHYVISGTAIEFGIPEDEVYAIVHAANMAKQGGPKRDDGKSLRPEGWRAPDEAIGALLALRIAQDRDERAAAISHERSSSSSNG